MRPEPIIPPKIWMPVALLLGLALLVISDRDAGMGGQPSTNQDQNLPESHEPTAKALSVPDTNSLPPTTLPENQRPRPAGKKTERVATAPVPRGEASSSSVVSHHGSNWLLWNQLTDDQRVTISERDVFARECFARLRRRPDLLQNAARLGIHWNLLRPMMWVSQGVDHGAIEEFARMVQVGIARVEEHVFGPLNLEHQEEVPIPVLLHGGADDSQPRCQPVGDTLWIELPILDPASVHTGIRRILSEHLRWTSMKNCGRTLPLWLHVGMVEWAAPADESVLTAVPQKLGRDLQMLILRSPENPDPEQLTPRLIRLSRDSRVAARSFVQYGMAPQNRAMFLDMVKAHLEGRMENSGQEGVTQLCEWFGVVDLAMVETWFAAEGNESMERESR